MPEPPPPAGHPARARPAQGAKNELHWDKDKAAWVAGCIAGGLFIIGMAAGIPYLKWRLKRDLNRQASPLACAPCARACWLHDLDLRAPERTQKSNWTAGCMT